MSSGTDQEFAGWLETVVADVDSAHRATGTISPHGSTGRAAQALAVLTGKGELRSAADLLELKETLATGGMGVIRLAHQVALGRDVAVKSTRVADTGGVARSELLREAWVTSRLQHPNVVPIHDLLLDDSGQPLVVLKQIVGTTWKKLMHDGAAVAERFEAHDLLSWNVDILLQVTNAVRYAHSVGVIHRDLKPENVMIGSFGEVYLVDWGLAVSLVDDGSGQLPLASAEVGKLAGTPAYMAPEMLGRDQAPLTERIDIYQLGALLYEITTGAPPHATGKLADVLRHVAANDIDYPDTMPSEIAAICRRALATAPDERYPEADEFRAALLAYVEHRGSAQLCERAAESLAKLRAHVAQTQPERSATYNLLGECRFGFRAALEAWQGNPDAIAGLTDAVEVGVDYELAHGGAEAAAALMHELRSPPAALQKRVEAALLAEGERASRLAEMANKFDYDIGSRTRYGVAVGTAAFWAAVPLAMGVLDSRYGTFATDNNYLTVTAVFTALVVILAGVIYWARDSLMRTWFNRTAAFSLLAGSVTTVLFFPALYLHDVDPVTGQALMIHLWFVVSVVISIAIEWRFLLISSGFYGATLLAGVWPELRFYFGAGALLIMLVVVRHVWGPQVKRAYGNLERGEPLHGSDLLRRPGRDPTER